MLLTLSCSEKSDDPTPIDLDPACTSCGVVEKYLRLNQLTVEPINKSKYSYEDMYATKRGIILKPEKKIHITAMGGMFRETGVYTLELCKMDVSPMGSITVNATGTDTFVFEKLSTPIILEARIEYIIWYCGKNHDSVYDVWLKENDAIFAQPATLSSEVTLTYVAWSYLQQCSDEVSSHGYFMNSNLLLRGIVDFKYEIVD